MGTLYLVGTPIGNLEDITQRARRVLAEVDLIAAEDTRVTQALLSHFDIHTPLVTYTDAYQRQKAARSQRVLDALAAGQSVALVSDAGMPTLADPGYELVGEARRAGHRVVVVPGPSAIVTALAASGLPSDRFTFVGYLPRKAASRRALLAELADQPGSLVAFEAPHRLAEALADVLAVLGDRPLAVARELTKKHEEVWLGSAASAVAHFTENPARGEITLVIGGAGRDHAAGTWTTAEVRRAVALLQAEGMAPTAVARVVAKLSGWPRAEVYALAKEHGEP